MFVKANESTIWTILRELEDKESIMPVVCIMTRREQMLHTDIARGIINMTSIHSRIIKFNLDLFGFA